MVMSTQSNALIKKKPVFNFVKRLLDILFSFIGISILLVPGIILAIIIRIGSKGFPLFLDPRVGKNNKDIKVLKFRSMVFDAESNIDHYLTPEQKEQWIKERKLDNDPRVTKLGRILRKTSIDELPQLFNIFIGNLSFVGPRPITRMELDNAFSEEERERLLSVKPGLTGCWQVYGRDTAEFDNGERQKLELSYIDERSLLEDAKIIFLTVPAVLKHKE